ncbi:uncharacterized protein JN550_003537 [Neoarthrinium moseri]|uniref:uncharacterized protein n=1 Tax=Neoarthrinium moseri TaxID=1658444 RepID=UPI001FDB70DC|nr:uncharacterized protein JN550_003537 [Neoarthrinium moseri]KAI1873284.1 hypothetical protein JN550_003537 [Neoarthrinium moseri]
MTLEHARWFKDGGYGLKDPVLLVSEHTRFTSQVGNGLPRNISGSLVASTKEELRQQYEHFAPQEVSTSSTTAINEFKNVSDSISTYQNRRQIGMRAVGAGLQRGMNDLSVVIAKFSSIVDAVAGAGGPYGQVGYQTLSILLIVFVNKSKNDDRLLSHIQQIGKALPDLETWKALYPTEIMKSLIASVYDGVIEFSREAVKYLCSFRRRLWTAINPLADPAHDGIAAEIYKTLGEVNAEAVLGLHKRASSIRQTAERSEKHILKLKEELEISSGNMQKVLAQNEELKAQLLEQSQVLDLARKQEDSSRYHAFEDVLEQRLSRAESNVATTKKTLKAIYPDVVKVANWIPHTTYIQMAHNTLFHLPEYAEWRDKDSCALLYINGSTDLGGQKLRSMHSWLSPAAIHAAEDLRDRGEKVAFFSCCPTLDPARVPPRDIFGSLILQVLSWNTEVLRDKNAEFRRLASHKTIELDQVQTLSLLLGTAISEVASKENVYIILDRPDCCQMTENSIDSGGLVMPVETVMNALVKLLLEAQKTGLRVKILAVVETSQGKGNWRYDFLPGSGDVTELVLDPGHWSQRKLTSSELAKSRPPIWKVDSAVTL